MGLIDYHLEDHIAIVTMNSGENTFTFEFFDAFQTVLDEIENKTTASVLVVKSGHEKIWSNGINLEWIMNLAQSNIQEVKRFPFELTKLYRRLLFYPLVTIAAMNGHAFAGGAIMAAAFDFRFMRSDRGFYCLPEVDINIPLSPSMIAIMKKTVPEYKFYEMQYLGIRMTAAECEKHHIILKACHVDTLMDEVISFAKPYNKSRKMIGVMKELTHQHMVKVFEEDDPAWFNSGRTGL
jgi:enoyl-CoA hydratase/carnithine racemase